DDVLPVRFFAAIPNNQRRRKQKLLLKSVMRMHPIRAASAHREVIAGPPSRRNRWPGNVRDAILLPRRRQAMPVDQARLFNMVFDPNAKRLAGAGGDSESPAGLAGAKKGRGLAVP